MSNIDFSLHFTWLWIYENKHTFGITYILFIIIWVIIVNKTKLCKNLIIVTSLEI